MSDIVPPEKPDVKTPTTLPAAKTGPSWVHVGLVIVVAVVIAALLITLWK